MHIKKIKLTSEKYKLAKSLYEKSFPKYDRFPFFLLYAQSFRDGIELNEIWDDKFIGFYFTVKSSKVLFLMYLAICDEFQSMGFGSRVIEYIKNKFPKQSIVLNTEILDDDAKDNYLRQQRYKFYEKNQIFDTGFGYKLNGEWYAVLSSSLEDFEPINYERVVRKFSLGFYNEFLSKRY